MPEHRLPPDKSTIEGLEPFEGLSLDRIFVVSNERQAGIAAEELTREGVVGFDTESKPTFRKGQVSEGPHVFQFATLEKAFIFQGHATATHDVLKELLRSAELAKVGFGLKGDFQLIQARFDLRPAATTDLDRSFKQLGYPGVIGTKSAIAILFNRRLMKSKSMTTSNWGAERLNDRQLLYAANDAYAALKVYHALRDRLQSL